MAVGDGISVGVALAVAEAVTVLLGVAVSLGETTKSEVAVADGERVALVVVVDVGDVSCAMVRVGVGDGGPVVPETDWPYTGHGAGQLMVPPSPSWPFPLFPQQYSTPPDASPQAWYVPPASAENVSPPVTAVGT